MADYPVLFQVAGRLCLVVGGGPVGLRKVRGLLAAGARVRLVSDRLAPGQTVPGGVEVIKRPFHPDDLQGAFLALAATGDAATDQTVVAEARRLGIPVSLPGDPAAGDFTLPALLRRGDLTLTVSTNGRCPALAAQLIRCLADWLDPSWATVAEIAAAIRRKSLALPEKLPYNQDVIARLLDAGLTDLVADGDPRAVDRLLRQVLGDGFSLAELHIEWPPEPT
jgi:precorrin-2 dehydrogenase/sirohydrochlorin ferrochelatase